MALEDDIRILGQVGLFSDLTAEQLRLMAFGAESLRLQAGREVYRAGQAADCAYVVASGAIDIVERTGGGQRITGSAGPGDILGELALIAPGERATGAVAHADSELIRLNRTLFRRILEEYPDVAARLHAKLARRLQALADQAGRLQRHFDR